MRARLDVPFIQTDAELSANVLRVRTREATMGMVQDVKGFWGVKYHDVANWAYHPRWTPLALKNLGHEMSLLLNQYLPC